MNNPECKYCGLLKSTVEGTDHLCVGDMEHDFSIVNSSATKPEPIVNQEWEDSYPLDTFFGGTKSELVFFISNLLLQQKTDLIKQLYKDTESILIRDWAKDNGIDLC